MRRATPDPILWQGFISKAINPDATIEEDYRSYIQKLPPEEGTMLVQ